MEEKARRRWGGWVGGWVGGWLTYRELKGLTDGLATAEQVAESNSAEGDGEDDLYGKRWVGGWVGARKIEEEEVVRMGYWTCVGGWIEEGKAV